MKTFDQSEHDTRIWYHGMAASKALSPGSAAISPSPDHREGRFALRYFSYFCYLPFFPHREAWSQAKTSDAKSIDMLCR